MDDKKKMNLPLFAMEIYHLTYDISELEYTFSPGMMPNAASKHAPDMRPCSRSSGLGASPNLPSGSDPMTLKYLKEKASISLLSDLVV